MKKQTQIQRAFSLLKRYKLRFLGVSIVFLLLFSSAMIFGFRDTNSELQQDIILTGNEKTAVFAGGCFWCMEPLLESQQGVLEVYSGYTGGDEATATYEQTSTKTTQHREAIQVVYDPEKISYETILELFWTQIDPTDSGGQFNDRGFVYSPAIFYANPEEKLIAEKSKKSLEDSNKFSAPINTTIEEIKPFYKAEEYHQDYYEKNPVRYGYYSQGSGRKDFIAQNWKERIAELENPSQKLQQTPGELRAKLSPLQYEVTQNGGTEKPFSNEYWDNTDEGIYVDIIDGTPLYSSLDKFDSGTGWPSFTKPLDASGVTELEDNTFFSTRTEVRSASSDAHLGHVFDDGPKELGGLRYCMNSAAMRFIPVDDLQDEGYGEYKKMFE